ncbi:phosphoribosyltransferase family protein [Chitinophaga sp.]|uniref:phosphoribosyltransferase n=1 Tax=Chitinophaga sp. TaxID=1869181 RepID=UPI0031DC2378
MYFNDRLQAAMQLAARLEKFKGEKGIILAVPRGGVPIGYYLARHLNFELDLLMTKKIGHPLHEEYAIGAVGLEDVLLEETDDIPKSYLEEKIPLIRQQLKERYKKFMNRERPANVKGKTVIIIDDGIATGRTILATLKMLRNKHPRKLVVAVPVASRQAAARIKKEVDGFICLYTPFTFVGVGGFYRDFSEVDDEEVMTLLKELNAKDIQRK